MATDITANKLTYEHYALFPNDGNRHEVIDGTHIMNPAPNLNHQSILNKINLFFYNEVEANGLGQVFIAPVDVALSEHNIVQPDLTVVLNDRINILTDLNIVGAPSLIVEVLSPSTEQYDRTLKKQLYQQAGVPEYWIVDVRGKQIEQYLLKDNVYHLQQTAEQITATIADGITFDSSALWP